MTRRNWRITRRHFTQGLGSMAAVVGLKTTLGCSSEPSGGQAGTGGASGGAGAGGAGAGGLPGAAGSGGALGTAGGGAGNGGGGAGGSAGQSGGAGGGANSNPGAPPAPGTVVHVQSSQATNWAFDETSYVGAVNQEVVDTMVASGLTSLTGAGSAALAWKQLIPGYVSGHKLAIKVNFNNYVGGTGYNSEIDALIEPVNAVLGTLIDFGFAPEHLAVYDVTHGLHDGDLPADSFVDRCRYPGVRFVKYKDNPSPYSSAEFVQFVSGVTPRPIANVLVESDWLINMPIFKAHVESNRMTLAFKHHFGSIDRCDLCHGVENAFVQIFKNKHFGPKTVLTMGDGLFGNWETLWGAPKRWTTFGNSAPNSLFFSADPVAFDSVLADLIEAEQMAHGQSAFADYIRGYIAVAESEGFGIHEVGDPWLEPRGSGYAKIKYRHVVL